MARIELTDDELILLIEGLDRILALKSRMAVPLEHVMGAHADPMIARTWWKGVRLPGTEVPGVLAAGTFYQAGHGELEGYSFWDVREPDRAIVIELSDEHFRRLVVGVEEPEATVAAIEAALARRSG